MKYIGKQPLKGSQGFSYILKKSSTQTIISDEQAVYGESESVLQPGESRVNTIVFNQKKRTILSFGHLPVIPLRKST